MVVTYVCGMEQLPSGEWVLRTAYEKLEAENKKLRKWQKEAVELFACSMVEAKGNEVVEWARKANKLLQQAKKGK